MEKLDRWGREVLGGEKGGDLNDSSERPELSGKISTEMPRDRPITKGKMNIRVIPGGLVNRKRMGASGLNIGSR